MSNPSPLADNAQRHVPQSTIDAAVDLFEQLKGFAHTADQVARCERQIGDVRALMEGAAQQAPGTLQGLHELRKVVQRKGESDIDAFSALLELLPYLSGAHGVYNVEFHYEGRVLYNVRKTLEGWEVCDTDGELVSLDEVFVMLRRRDLTAGQVTPAPEGAPA